MKAKTKPPKSLTTCPGFDRLSVDEQRAVAHAFQDLETRQQRFVLEYLADLNATKAAERAGYAKNSASEQGTRLLAKVSAVVVPLLRAQQQELAEDTGITRKRWLQEIQRIAFHDPRRFFNEHGEAIDLPKLGDDVAAAIAGFEIVEEFAGQGKDRECVGYTKKYKLIDKLRALELFGKATGYLVEKHEHTGPNGQPIPHQLTVRFVESKRA